MKTLKNIYEEQFETRKGNLTLDSLKDIDRENEPIYDAGFINGMRFIMYRQKGVSNIDIPFLTEAEILHIIEQRNV